jgi:hypothetical protein
MLVPFSSPVDPTRDTPRTQVLKSMERKVSRQCRSLSQSVLLILERNSSAARGRKDVSATIVVNCRIDREHGVGGKVV